jgi:hypothetical protein
MGVEQGGISPEEFKEFDSKKLVVQDGEDKGRIEAEYIPGKYVEVAPDSQHSVGEETMVVDGLPRKGAEVHDDILNKERKKKHRITKLTTFGKEKKRGLKKIAEGDEFYANRVAEAQMAWEVGGRAKDLAVDKTKKEQEQIQREVYDQFSEEIGSK